MPPRPRTHPHGGGADAPPHQRQRQHGDGEEVDPRRRRTGPHIGDSPTVAHAQEATAHEMHLGRPGGGTGGSHQTGKPPLALPPGPTHKLSMEQIKRIRDRQERADAAEDFARELYGGGPERHYPVSPNSDPDFPVTGTGGRKVDVPVDLPGGGTLAVEVKMYQQYRTVKLPDGTSVTHKVEVPLSSEIRQQINKDVALHRADPTYDPRWDFHGAGPSPELREYLTRAGIVFIERN